MKGWLGGLEKQLDTKYKEMLESEQSDVDDQTDEHDSGMVNS